MQHTGPDCIAEPHLDWLGRLDKPLAEQLRFLLRADGLKRVERGSPLTDRSRRENSAEHSWHLALFAIVLADHADDRVDLARVLQMLLIHDLVEVECGDTPLFDEAARALKAEREAQAARALFGMLPATQGGRMLALWEEYELGITADARFAKALDRLQPMLQNHAARGGTWLDYDVDIERERRLTSGIADGSAALWALARLLMEDAAACGWLRRGASSLVD